MTPYQVAREVARTIIHHPGATARELYRLHGDGFAEHGYDGTRASGLIQQHLAAFEKDGLVIRETGKKNNPAKWTWTGPKPHVELDATSEPAEIEREAEQFEPEAPSELERVPAGPVTLFPSDPFDALLIAVRDAATKPRIDNRAEKMACLARLAEITAPDISALLIEIGSDLGA